MKYLRQSTAATISMGPFSDATDGVTRETGLTVTVKLSKNGGALGARSSATAITHDADGYYPVAVDATDTGTIGRLRVDATAAGALPVWEDFTVLDEAVYDVIFGTTAPSTHTAAAVQALVAAGAVASVTATVNATLVATGLDAIAVTAPTGVATTFPQMVVQTWRRFFRKVVKTDAAITTYADNGSTAVTTQTISSASGTDTQGAAS